MWPLLLIAALGRMPCLPEELGHVPGLDPTPPLEAATLPPPVAVAARPSRPARMAPVFTAFETARYSVNYGVFGQLGEITIALAPTAASTVHVTGTGKGSFLGLGAIQKNLDGEFHPLSGGSRRWTTTRHQGGKVITDSIEQATPGSVAIVRHRGDRADEASTFSRQRPVEGPIGFLLQLRSTPTKAPRVIEVLDGRALWIMKMATPVIETLADRGGERAWRFDGTAEPIFWNGQPDPERGRRRFSLWMADDPARTPLRMRMPTGLGDVRVDLVSVERPATVAAGR